MKRWHTLVHSFIHLPSNLCNGKVGFSVVFFLAKSIYSALCIYAYVSLACILFCFCQFYTLYYECQFCCLFTLFGYSFTFWMLITPCVPITYTFVAIVCIWRAIHEWVKTIHRTSNASEWINCDVPLCSTISDITNGTGILKNKIQIRIDKILYVVYDERWTINEKNQNKNCFFSEFGNVII